jgi:hypothetical protein
MFEIGSARGIGILRKPVSFSNHVGAHLPFHLAFSSHKVLQVSLFPFHLFGALWMSASHIYNINLLNIVRTNKNLNKDKGNTRNIDFRWFDL